jgi:MoxR-like ATPase
MPSDLTGFSLYNRTTGQMEYQPGALLCNLLLALMDEMDAALVREQKASNPRLKKYLDKYQRRGGK